MKKAVATGGLMVGVLGVLAGCAGGSGSGVSSGLEASERYVTRDGPGTRSNTGADIVVGESVRESGGQFATVAGSAVNWERVKPLLAEAAGGIVLEEVALEMMLEGEMRRRGLRLTPAMVEREQLLLRESLEQDDASGSADEAQRLLDQIRRQRGLGPERYQALLRRTAMLRALVQERVRVDPVSVERAYRIRYEPRMRVRIITADTVDQAERARERVLAGEAFSRVAAEVSTDVSGVRGGVIEPISPADPTYPDALRSAIARMSVGEVSRPIVMEVDGPAQVAVVVLDEIVRPERTPSLESVRAELERLVRLREERLLMDALSRQLLAEARVTALDAGVSWSWRSRGG